MNHAVLGFEWVKGGFSPQKIPLDMLTGVQLYRIYRVYSASCLLVFDCESCFVLDFEVVKGVFAPQNIVTFADSCLSCTYTHVPCICTFTLRYAYWCSAL